MPSNLFPSSSGLRTPSENVDVETVNIHADDDCMHIAVNLKPRHAKKIFIKQQPIATLILNAAASYAMDSRATLEIVREVR